MINHALFTLLFAAFVTLYFPEILQDANERNKAQQSNEEPLKENYDFIIIGAGSAGSVLTRRLLLASNWSILLLEAGGDETAESRTPLLHYFQRNNERDWNYTTVKQDNACLDLEGMCEYPRGHVMGGSSSINGLMYIRGNQRDFDEWAESDPAASGWSYQNVTKYFKRMENVSLDGEVISEGRGRDGPLTVQHAKFQPELVKDLIKGGMELGLPNKDYNEPDQISVSVPQITVDGARRKSSSSAYIDSLYVHNKDDNRLKNLKIIKGAFVNRIEINPSTKTATGVEFSLNGKIYSVKANKEIILSAGSVNSPKLLMLSGIGPKEHLAEHNITLISDLPVGRNFHDHVQVFLPFKLRSNVSIKEDEYRSNETLHDYAINKKGSLSTNALITVLFLNTTDLLTEPPDVVFHVMSMQFHPIKTSVISLSVGLLKPDSVGWVKLRSSDPNHPPLINPNYFNREKDLKTVVSGMKKAMELMKTDVMKKYQPELMTNSLPPSCRNISDEGFSCFAKYKSTSQYHPVGSCKMGSNPSSSVVNWDLMVHTIDRLRVVDASVMPRVTRANTNAPTIMIAEKASDIIAQRWLSNNSS